MFDAKLEPFKLPIKEADSPAGIFISPTLNQELLSPHSTSEPEGELSVDVLDAGPELVIVATMAGTRPEDIELHLHNDFLTIRGRREPPPVSAEEYYYQECFWGKFSRTIVLPVDVRSEMARSEYRNGVLIIHLPKAGSSSTIPIMVIEE
ncbi:MAG: Hsp20/alpha crystallin family protein [Candidatus Magasanikbacteria bacterium]|nr:Hsp20/alpha crystallin family protein [Candidatus Magasanikbacteria bacterium]